MKRVLLLSFVLAFAFATTSPAPPIGNTRCPMDTDAGTLVCRARCDLYSVCKVDTQLAITSYCWRAKSVEGSWIACHEGEYDRCCDPYYQW